MLPKSQTLTPKSQTLTPKSTTMLSVLAKSGRYRSNAIEATTKLLLGVKSGEGDAEISRRSREGGVRAPEPPPITPARSFFAPLCRIHRNFQLGDDAADEDNGDGMDGSDEGSPFDGSIMSSRSSFSQETPRMMTLNTTTEVEKERWGRSRNDNSDHVFGTIAALRECTRGGSFAAGGHGDGSRGSGGVKSFFVGHNVGGPDMLSSGGLECALPVAAPLSTHEVLRDLLESKEGRWRGSAYPAPTGVGGDEAGGDHVGGFEGLYRSARRSFSFSSANASATFHSTFGGSKGGARRCYPQRGDTGGGDGVISSSRNQHSKHRSDKRFFSGGIPKTIEIDFNTTGGEGEDVVTPLSSATSSSSSGEGVSTTARLWLPRRGDDFNDVEYKDFDNGHEKCRGGGRYPPPPSAGWRMEAADADRRAEQEVANCVSTGEETEATADLLLSRINECLEMPRKSIPDLGAAVAATTGADVFSIVGTPVKHENKGLNNDGEWPVWPQEREGDIFSDRDSGERIAHLLNATMYRSPVAADNKLDYINIAERGSKNCNHFVKEDPDSPGARTLLRRLSTLEGGKGGDEDSENDDDNGTEDESSVLFHSPESQEISFSALLREEETTTTTAFVVTVIDKLSCRSGSEDGEKNAGHDPREDDALNGAAVRHVNGVKYGGGVVATAVAVKEAVFRETEDQGRKMGHSADNQKDNAEEAAGSLNFLLLGHRCNGTTLTDAGGHAGGGESYRPVPPLSGVTRHVGIPQQSGGVETMIEAKCGEGEEIPAVSRLIRKFETMQGGTAVDQGEVTPAVGASVSSNRNGLCCHLCKTNPEFLQVWQKVLSDGKLRQEEVDDRRGGLATGEKLGRDRGNLAPSVPILPPSVRDTPEGLGLKTTDSRGSAETVKGRSVDGSLVDMMGGVPRQEQSAPKQKPAPEKRVFNATLLGRKQPAFDDKDETAREDVGHGKGKDAPYQRGEDDADGGSTGVEAWERTDSLCVADKGYRKNATDLTSEHSRIAGIETPQMEAYGHIIINVAKGSGRSKDRVPEQAKEGAENKEWNDAKKRDPQQCAESSVNNKEPQKLSSMSDGTISTNVGLETQQPLHTKNITYKSKPCDGNHLYIKLGHNVISQRHASGCNLSLASDFYLFQKTGESNISGRKDLLSSRRNADNPVASTEEPPIINIGDFCEKDKIQENPHKNECILKYSRFKARSENKDIRKRLECTGSATVPVSKGGPKKLGAAELINQRIKKAQHEALAPSFVTTSASCSTPEFLKIRKKLRKVGKNGQTNLQVRPTGSNIDIGKSPQKERESLQLQNIDRSASNDVRPLNSTSYEKAQIQLSTAIESNCDSETLVDRMLKETAYNEEDDAVATDCSSRNSRQGMQLALPSVSSQESNAVAKDGSSSNSKKGMQPALSQSNFPCQLEFNASTTNSLSVSSKESDAVANDCSSSNSKQGMQPALSQSNFACILDSNASTTISNTALPQLEREHDDVVQKYVEEIGSPSIMERECTAPGTEEVANRVLDDDPVDKWFQGWDMELAEKSALNKWTECESKQSPEGKLEKIPIFDSNHVHDGTSKGEAEGGATNKAERENLCCEAVEKPWDHIEERVFHYGDAEHGDVVSRAVPVAQTKDKQKSTAEKLMGGTDGEEYFEQRKENILCPENLREGEACVRDQPENVVSFRSETIKLEKGLNSAANQYSRKKGMQNSFPWKKISRKKASWGAAPFRKIASWYMR